MAQAARSVCAGYTGTDEATRYNKEARLRYATLLNVADIPLPEDELNAIEVLAGYGLEVVRVDKVGGANYWHIKVAGPETHAPGRFMDWNEGTLEITS